MFIEVPIIGSGTARDPFRPKLPDTLSYSAHIQTGKNGLPVLTKCLVCVPDAFPVPADGKFFAKQDAILSIKGSDSKVDPSLMKVSGAS